MSLVGVNRWHFHDDPAGDWGAWNNFITVEAERELDYLRDVFHINCLRLTFAINYWKYNVPTKMDGAASDHRTVVKKVVELCAERGIQVIYCPFCVDGGGGFSGSVGLPYPPNRYTGATIRSLQEFVDYFVSVSRELRQFPNVIYELWNEPPETESITQWYDGWTQVINAIRHDGDGAPVVVQWGFAAYHSHTLDWVFNYPFPQGNIIYSTHEYIKHFDDCDPTSYESLKQKLVFLKFQEVASKHRLLVGEIGANTGDGERGLKFFDNALRIFNEWGVGYTAWVFWDNYVYSLVSNKGARVTDATVPTASGQILINRIVGIEQAPAPVFTCSICGVTFNSEAELVAHTLSVHPVEPVPYVAGSPMWVATECGLSQFSIDKLRVLGHNVLSKDIIDLYHDCGEDFAVFLHGHPDAREWVRALLLGLLSVIK